MSSPFPGMNPYLEQRDVWHDFHDSFIAAIRAAISPSIRPAYLAKIDDNVYIHELSAEERFLMGRPAVAVLESGAPAVSRALAATIRAPLYGQVLPATDTIHESFIEIRDRESRRLITVIEVLSPTNKEIGPDRDQYIAKRRQLLASSVHLVEIDLLRGGPPTPIEDLPQCDYVVMVSRYEERPRVGLWPIGIRDSLPEIPIPLAHGDADVMLSLGSVVNDVDRAAGYEDYIYQGHPRPALRPEDASWAQGLLAN